MGCWRHCPPQCDPHLAPHMPFPTFPLVSSPQPNLEHLRGGGEPVLGRRKGKLRHAAISPGMWTNPPSPAHLRAMHPCPALLPATGFGSIPMASPHNPPVPAQYLQCPCAPAPAAGPRLGCAAGPGFRGCVGSCSEAASEGESHKIPAVTSFLPAAAPRVASWQQSGAQGGDRQKLPQGAGTGWGLKGLGALDTPLGAGCPIGDPVD